MEASVGEKDKMEGRLLSVVSGLVVEGTRALYLSIYTWRNMYFCDLVRYVDADILHRFAGLHSLSSYLENEYPTPLAASMSQIPGPTAAVLMCGLDD